MYVHGIHGYVAGLRFVVITLLCLWTHFEHVVTDVLKLEHAQLMEGWWYKDCIYMHTLYMHFKAGWPILTDLFHFHFHDDKSCCAQWEVRDFQVQGLHCIVAKDREEVVSTHLHLHTYTFQKKIQGTEHILATTQSNHCQPHEDTCTRPFSTCTTLSRSYTVVIPGFKIFYKK